MKIVSNANTSHVVCTQVPLINSAPNTKYTTRSIPSTPIFTMIPDITALAGAGATGCAVGNHACIGNIPAFTPKPKIMANAATKSKPSFPATNSVFKAPPAVKFKVTAYLLRK